MHNHRRWAAIGLLLATAPACVSTSSAEDKKPPITASAAKVVSVADSNAASTNLRALTRTGARVAVDAVIAEARRRGVGAAVSVVDEGGHLVAAERADGTFSAGPHVSEGKARTAVAFKRPTAFFEKIIREGRTPMVALDDFTPLQGGIPVEVAGQIIGGVGVSGASNAAEDEELATVGANAILAALGAPVPSQPLKPVAYFGHDKVAQAFEKGMPIVETSEYKIHASRRDSAGMVEVHARDTDIIHVLSGKASVVTGGRMIDGKPSAADEVRGVSIEGGETRELSPGDVFVIPHGVPHWFRSVQAPFTYYVVKVH